MNEHDLLIRLTDVPDLRWLPRRRGGSRLHTATVWRWALKGVTARDGSRIKLRCVRVGEALSTSEAWLRDFFTAITEHDPQLATPATTPRQRRVAAANAEQELDKLGL